MSWIDVKKSAEEYTTAELAQYPYFAYGSNLYYAQMSDRCPESKIISPAILEGYKLIFRKVADVTKRKNEHVNGVLYNVTEEDVKRLHKFEGYPFKYIVKVGDVLVGEKKKKAFWYEIRDKKANLSSIPTGFYFAKIASGYASFGLNANALYNSIRRVQNAVNARMRKEALKEMEREAIYDRITWLDKYQQLGLLHNDIENR